MALNKSHLVQLKVSHVICASTNSEPLSKQPTDCSMAAQCGNPICLSVITIDESSISGVWSGLADLLLQHSEDIS